MFKFLGKIFNGVKRLGDTLNNSSFLGKVAQSVVSKIPILNIATNIPKLVSNVSDIGNLVKSSNKSNTSGNIVKGIGKGIGAVSNLTSLLL
tara:strand:- start:763 stop:1035 length:273 start_codon:yes stop_codon:yes gene_type:complete